MEAGKHLFLMQQSAHWQGGHVSVPQPQELLGFSNQGFLSFAVLELKWGEGRTIMLTLLSLKKSICFLFLCNTCHFPFDLHLESKDFIHC